MHVRWPAPKSNWGMYIVLTFISLVFLYVGVKNIWFGGYHVKLVANVHAKVYAATGTMTE
jgi:hypothetical protein